MAASESINSVQYMVTESDVLWSTNVTKIGRDFDLLNGQPSHWFCHAFYV